MYPCKMTLNTCIMLRNVEIPTSWYWKTMVCCISGSVLSRITNQLVKHFLYALRCSGIGLFQITVRRVILYDGESFQTGIENRYVHSFLMNPNS